MADTVGGGFPSSGIQKGNIHFDVDDSTLWEFISGDPRLVSSWKLLNGIFAANPDTSLWGLAQQGAMWWNQSEARLKVWSGDSVQDITPNSSLYRYPTTIMLQDDFVTGVSSSGTIGVLSWFVSGGTQTSVAVGTTGRPGIFRRDTSAVAGTVAALLLSGQQQQFPLTVDQDLMWVCRLNQVDVDTICRIGMSNGATANPLTGSAAVFEKLAVDVNWFAAVYAGGVATRIDTGVPIDTSFHEFGIIVDTNGTRYQFLLDNRLVATATVGIPVVSMQPATHIVNVGAVSKTLDHDYFQLIVSNIARAV